MAEKLRWTRRPLWQSAIIVCSVLVWCLYLAFCWISSLPMFAQVFLGIAIGFTSMASYSFTQTQRSYHRRLTSVHLAQLSMADMLALQRLLPDHEKALSWLPDASDVELVRWINAGLEKAWPYFKESSTGLIKEQLQAMLNKYRSGVIQEVLVGKINLGKRSPYIQGVKVFPTNEDNKVCLEIQLDWRQNEDQEILVHLLTLGPEYVVQVKHFVIYCVMQLTFVPLLEELPCFAALVISIVEPPLVDFQTKVISGDVKKMPEMQKAVDNTFVAALMDLLVWPGRVVVPFLPGDYSDLEASCEGHLHVQLLEAKDLANKDIVGNSNPYVVLFVRRRQDLVKESSQVHNTSEPVWNEQFVFNVEDSKVQKLTIKVMNVDDTNLDVFVGIAELAINQLEANTQEDLWIDLVGDPSRLHGDCAGKIHLLIEFKPLNLSCAESDSSSRALGKSPHSAAPLTQSSGNVHFIGEKSHIGGINVSDGLRAVLEGHSTISENAALRLTMVMDAFTPSASDSSVLDRTQLTQKLDADAKVDEPCKLVDDEHLACQEDKTEIASHINDNIAKPANRDGLVISECPLAPECASKERGVSENILTECTLPPECESEEKCVNGFGTTESPQVISTESPKESQQTPRDFTEGLSTSSIKEMQVVENETRSDCNADGELMQRQNVIVGDPMWGLNGLSIEHCNSSAIHEDMFAMEIFEVD